MTVKCPACKQPVKVGTADFPFCSERCRLLDLGRWADEDYRIPGESASQEDVSGSPAGTNGDESEE